MNAGATPVYQGSYGMAKEFLELTWSLPNTMLGAGQAGYDYWRAKAQGLSPEVLRVPNEGLAIKGGAFSHWNPGYYGQQFFGPYVGVAEHENLVGVNLAEALTHEFEHTRQDLIFGPFSYLLYKSGAFLENEAILSKNPFETWASAAANNPTRVAEVMFETNFGIPP